jgi:hypothetical protein
MSPQISPETSPPTEPVEQPTSQCRSQKNHNIVALEARRGTETIRRVRAPGAPKREKINAILQGIIDEATAPWGIKVSIVEVRDVEIPANMQQVMARQAEAERERRAKVINA